MSDDSRSGPRGPRKPGGPRGGGRDGGGFKGRDGGGGFKGGGASRSGGFKPGGFKSAGGGGTSGFRDAPAEARPRRFEGEDQRPRRFEGQSERPRRFEGADQGQKPYRDRGGDRPYAPRGQRADQGDRPPVRFARDEQPGSGAPRTSSRPERWASLPRTGNVERLASPEKEGGVERIAKVIARAGAASRREAEEMIEQGRVTVNGERIASPALDVAPDARITVDGEPLPARERTRLWLYHKPSGLVSTNHDPEGRQTLFEALPEDLPRVITVGRLDINTEGLLLLTNDGGLARVLGHPETGWLRRYRVRAYGEITQDKLDAVRGGVTIEGENFGPVIATRDRQVGDNTWLTVDLREGKNREVKRVLEHLGLVVNRLIRISFGPFQLGDLEEGQVEEVRTKVLRDQIGGQLAEIAGVDFDAPVRGENRIDRPHAHEPERRPARGEARGEGRGEGRGEAPRGRPREGRFEERPRGEGRFGDKPRGEGRFGDKPRGFGADKAERPRREGAYHRAREEGGDAPRDILLRAEEGRGAIWRDEETTGMKPKRTGPRRGADPREERASREAAGGRERVRAAPIEDPKGRRVTVERVTGASPDLPRKPRYTRADFAAPTGEERPFRRPRDEDGGGRPRREEGGRAPRHEEGGRPPRRDGERSFRPRDGDRPFRPRAEGGGEGFKPRAQRGDFGDRAPRRDDGERGPRRDGPRPPRPDGERSFKPRDGDRPFKPRDGDRPFKPRDGDRPFKPRDGDRPFKPRDGDRPFKPRAEGERPARSFSPGTGPRGGAGGKPGGRPPGRGGPARSGAARSPDRGGGARPKGPRKPRD
jgi:23S rRNA pseudouridine2605 synthase